MFAFKVKCYLPAYLLGIPAILFSKDMDADYSREIIIYITEEIQQTGDLHIGTEWVMHLFARDILEFCKKCL